MNAKERALAYLKIFIGVGDRWEFYIPVEGERTKDGVLIDGVEVGPVGDGGWFLRADGKLTIYRKAVKA